MIRRVEWVPPRVWAAWGPKMRGFAAAFGLAMPDYVNLRCRVRKRLKGGNQGLCFHYLRFRRGKTVRQDFIMVVTRADDVDTWLHEFAHALDRVVRPGEDADGVPTHNPGWGNAYAICFAWFHWELVQVRVSEGFVSAVHRETGTPHTWRCG